MKPRTHVTKSLNQVSKIASTNSALQFSILNHTSCKTLHTAQSNTNQNAKFYLPLLKGVNTFYCSLRNQSFSSWKKSMFWRKVGVNDEARARGQGVIARGRGQARTEIRGGNIFGLCAIVNVIGLRRDNITLSAAFHFHSNLGLYSKLVSIRFIDTRCDHPHLSRAERSRAVQVWCHLGKCDFPAGCSGPQLAPTIYFLYLPPYSPFLNPTEELFSIWAMEGAWPPSSCMHVVKLI